MKRLIVGPAWVGDMVMAQSLFITLKQQDPSGVIDVLAPAWTSPLLARMPEVRRAIDMPVGHGELGLGRRWRLARQLAGEGYGQAIVLPNSFKSALLPRFAGIARRTGWRGEARGWLLNDCRRLDKSRYPLMVQRFVALAYPPDARLPERLPWPALHAGSDTQAVLEKQGLTRHAPVLALCPGAEFGSSKRWPESHYAAVATAMAQQGYQAWLMGSAKDRAVAGNIIEAMPADLQGSVHNLCGSTSLGEAIDLLSLADLAVSNDSGLMHILAALDKPMVVVYGSTSADFTPPLADKVHTLSLDLECSPCFARECPLGHHRCMRELQPSMVLDALAKQSQAV